ncbi:hypothetical protein [Nocardioides sp. MH1]|uniref:hypothetical protein n=1 Tax=Nocardioides sp. MH1 TaxID=3242490 RepID=UPI00351FFFAB
MRLRRRDPATERPATTPTPSADRAGGTVTDGGDRCPDCGTGVLRVSVGAGTLIGDARWRRCDDCRNATAVQLVSRALTAAGVEHPDDPLLLGAIARRLRWRAQVAHERINAPDPIEQASPTAIARHWAQVGIGAPAATPWEHVSPTEAREAVETVQRNANRVPRPRRSRRGVCGICSVNVSCQWHRPRQIRPTTMTTGPAVRWPLCSDCAAVLASSGGIVGSDRHRRRVLADLFGVPVTLALPAVVRFYGELTDGAPTDAPGHPERYGYIGDEDRARLHQLAPQTRPAAVREREARVRAAAARIAAAGASSRTSAVIERSEAR